MPGLDFVGTIVLIAAVVININALSSAMPIGHTARLGFTAAAGLWVGLQVALSGAGVFGSPAPFVGLAVMLPRLAAAIALRTPGGREALLAVPMSTLVGVNIARVFGAFFLLLAADGRLDGPFPQSAGWGDVVTGLTAIPLAFLILRKRATPMTVGAWNAFGALDLIAAVALGLLTASGSPLQLIDAGVGSAAVAGLPWTLIPTALVPFYLVTHWVIFLQLRQGAALSHRQPATP